MADFRRTKFGGEFGTSYFFGGFSADHFRRRIRRFFGGCGVYSGVNHHGVGSSTMCDYLKIFHFLKFLLAVCVASMEFAGRML